MAKAKKTETDLFKDLKAPIRFKWKVQTAKDWGCELVAYVDARDVMNRLDRVVGPDNWCDEYHDIAGKVYCTLSIRINGEWIGKTDCGAESSFEPEKGQASDAFKRAAVKWGIGRFLYELPLIRTKSVQQGTDKNNKPKYVPAMADGKKIPDLTKYCSWYLGKRGIVFTYPADEDEENVIDTGNELPGNGQNDQNPPAASAGPPVKVMDPKAANPPAAGISIPEAIEVAKQQQAAKDPASGLTPAEQDAVLTSANKVLNEHLQEAALLAAIPEDQVADAEGLAGDTGEGLDDQDQVLEQDQAHAERSQEEVDQMLGRLHTLAQQLLNREVPKKELVKLAQDAIVRKLPPVAKLDFNGLAGDPHLRMDQLGPLFRLYRQRLQEEVARGYFKKIDAIADGFAGYDKMNDVPGLLSMLIDQLCDGDGLDKEIIYANLCCALRKAWNLGESLTEWYQRFQHETGVSYIFEPTDARFTGDYAIQVASGIKEMFVRPVSREKVPA